MSEDEAALAEVDRAAELVTRDDEPERLDVVAACEAVETFRRARENGAGAKLVAGMERRARAAVAALPRGAERAALEEQLAGRALPASAEPAGDVENDQEDENVIEEEAVSVIEPETTTDEAETEQPKRRRKRAGARVPAFTCATCGRLIRSNVAFSNHVKRCEREAKEAPRRAPKLEAATPEAALAACRAALAPLSPEVRKLALELLVATS